MAPLDWDAIISANPTGLNDEEAETFYDMIKDASVDGELDVSKVLQLFKITKAVMINRNNMVEESMAEAEEEAKKSKKKEQELKNEQEKLLKELNELKRFGPDSSGAGGTTARDSRYLRDMVRELEESNEQLKQEVKDLNRDLNAEKRAAEKYSERISELEKELKDLREDNDQMRQDLSDYKMQVQAQRENIMSHQGDDMGLREKLARKNHELAEVMEELQNLTDSNEILQKRCDDLQTKLEEAVQQMDNTSEDYVKLKAVLQQSDSVTDRLRKENEILKNQVQDLTEQVQSKSEADDAIMVAVSNKIEEWQELVGQKDQQISDLQEQLFRMREQLIAANMDSDKASISALTQVVKEKDQQIQQLTEQTNQYINEMDASAALVDDLRAELSRAGAGGGDRLQTKIRELQQELTAVKEQLKTAEEDTRKAEEDARAKDKELNEALERMQQYERGEYGLEEAVIEIKEKKTQIKVRDKQIDELTKYINTVELRINEILDENEELRYKLGMDPKAPLDLTEFKKNKAIRHEEEKALNFILQRQIEQLEEERVNDKQKIRKLAQQLGKRAVDLGLTAEDMMAVQDYTDTLRVKRKTQEESESAAVSIKRNVEKQELQIMNHELDKDYRQNLVELNQMEREVAELRSRCTQLQQDNEHLENGLKEVMEALNAKHTQEPASGDLESALHFPAIERMLAAIEAKRVIGNYDTSLYLKEQVDILRGRNEEIRAELRQSRIECAKLQQEQDKAFEKLERIHGGMPQGGIAPTIVQTFPLPEGLAPTSAEVIASLNEHLIITLQELSQCKENMEKMEKSLEKYKLRFGVVRHQQSLLYQEYLRDKQEWKDDSERFSRQIKELQGTKEENSVKIAEFDRLLDTLGQDDAEVRRRLSEMTRQVIVLRVNEKSLVRTHNTMEEIEDTLRKENNRLRNEMNQMESAISERMGFLQRYKDLASFKIASLQKALEESVPQAELGRVNKEYHQLTEKYRDLLEKGNTLVSKTQAISCLENEVKQLMSENEELKSTLHLEKERLHALEAVVEELHRKGVTSGAEERVTDADILSISKKLTLLEMKELNERQRAEHAVRMYEQQRQQFADLEARNKQLEEKFAEVTKMNLEMQKTERDLRDELSNSVTKAVSDADRKRIAELEHQEIVLRQEISKLKDVADVASTQVRTLEVQQISHEKENKSLRQQLLDFQVQSDDKTLIGKLHRTIVQLQISESTAVKQLEASKKRVSQLEAAVLRLEHKVDTKEQSLFHSRQETQAKVRYLKQSLQAVRLQFAGAVPLSKQEKFSKNMIGMQQDKARLEQELKQVHKQREDSEDTIAELTAQKEGLQELMSTLKDGRGAAKVAEWHSKIESVRLEELRQRRINAKLHQQIKYLEEILRSHEVSISVLEKDNVRLLKDFEERQMRWEQREGELERTILVMERQTAEITGAASRFEQAIGTLPDAKMPVANQLEEAITTIKTNVKLILDTQAENKALKTKVIEMERVLKDSERTLIEREKLISELRLRMPATADRDEIIKRVADKVHTGIAKLPEEPDYQTQHGLKIAQSTVNSLQQRIQQKEETIVKYQELLNQARQDMIDMNRRHEQELKTMQHKIHATSDVAFSKFKEAAQELISKHVAVRRQSISEQKLQRLGELEDLVADQENTISALHDKLKEREEQIITLQAKIVTIEKRIANQLEKMQEDHAANISQKDHVVVSFQKTIAEQQKEIVLLKEEITALKETNLQGPTASMKNLVERLKNQLAIKDEQHQKLSKALTELKAEMVIQAQRSILAHAEEAQQEHNVHRLIDQHTKDIAEQLDESKSELERTKRELKKRKESEGLLQTELEDVKEELGRQVRAGSKLRASKTKLELDVDELEKKLERFSCQRAQKTADFERMQELEDMRRRNRYLEEELKKRTTAEKPFEQKEEKAKIEETLRWEESKKWQRTIEKMKSKIREKDQEIEKLTQAVERLKASLDRISREKDALESKSKISKSSVGMLSATPATHLDHDKEDLRKINFHLEQQISDLKRQAMLSRDAALKEAHMQNSHMREQIEQLERALSQKAQEGGVDVAEYQQLFEKNQALQREVLHLSEENMELRFEVEAARKDAPRLKERISDLEKYIEALKQENAQLSGESARSAASSIRRFGESGKSTRELEKTIALLKKVVERVQMENERLKKAPGVVSNEQMALLKKENEQLMVQMEELRQQMGATLSERYTSQQKGTAKMMNDYEQMRRELTKEKEANEKLRIQVKGLEQKGEQKQRDLMEAKSKLAIEAAKRPSTAAASDQQGWLAAVNTRMSEEKIRSLQTDNDKKTKQLSDMKTLLRDAAEREQALISEKEEFQRKIGVLEQFPAGSQGAERSLVRDYQQARLQIQRLESEKKQLANDLRILQQAGTTGPELTSEVLMKANKYEELVKENMESNLANKSLTLEKQKLTIEVEKMKQELNSFGPDFFDEIEDLKYHYKQSVERCSILENKLQQVARQFGVSIDIAGID